jgi:hypothetical protein
VALQWLPYFGAGDVLGPWRRLMITTIDTAPFSVLRLADFASPACRRDFTANSILARAINRSRVVERSGALWPRLEQHPDQFGLPMRIRLIENSFKMSACVTDRDANLVSRFGNALPTGQ